MTRKPDVTSVIFSLVALVAMPAKHLITSLRVALTFIDWDSDLNLLPMTISAEL